MKRRAICVITGSRAEYGLLSGLMHRIHEDPSLELQIIATGTHLAPQFGNTYRVIERDGFKIDAKVPILSKGTTTIGVTHALGLAVQGVGMALARLKPSWVVLLGDRYEILAAAEAALISRIPIAHIAGGDITEGAYDDAMRYAITKMSHLHFVTHAKAAERVRQVGEDPRYIYNVGSPGLDTIRELNLLDRAAFHAAAGFHLRRKNLLITFHPVTLDRDLPQKQCRELLMALNRLGPSVGLIFTKPNADTGGLTLIKAIETFASRHPNAKVFDSMGQLLYLSAMKHVDAVVGNSSSGLYEAPSFKKPTVNIGDRQKGRMQASSVINCPPQAQRIWQAIRKAFRKDCSKAVNPYGDGRAAVRILRVLKGVRDPQQLIQKKFCGSRL